MESEVKYWSQLTVDFMTEESDDDDDRNALVVHHLLWRSKSKLVQHVLAVLCELTLLCLNSRVVRLSNIAGQTV